MSSPVSPSARFLKILAPSISSGTIAVTLAVSVVVTVLTPYFYKGSYLEQYGEILVKTRGEMNETYAMISRELNSSELVGNIVIFCLWAIMGFAVYYLLLSLLSLVIDVMRFASLLGYGSSNNKSIVMEAGERLALRVLGIVSLGVFLVVVFLVALPAILTLIAASFSSSYVLGAVYLTASVLFLAAIVHIVVVLLRVIFLRTRLIFQPYDSIES
jgi:hypothetical protein